MILPSLSQLLICSFASQRSPAYRSDAKYGLTESALPSSPLRYFVTISAKKVLPYWGKSVLTTGCPSLSNRSHNSFVCTVLPLPSIPVMTISFPCIKYSQNYFLFKTALFLKFHLFIVCMYD